MIMRRITVLLLILGASMLMPALSRPERSCAAIVLNPAEATETSAVALTDGQATRLWDAQSELMERAIGGLEPRLPGRPNIYAMAVAAGGSQQLFGREAHLALQVAAARFGASYRGGLLLSNGLADILHSPLATQANMIAAAHGLVGRLDPAQDVAFIYLVSHGTPNAMLSTDLPNHKYLTWISAASVADALDRAGIRRRIIVISACFSGTWIPALASPDSIIITAARKDRTSFGCDDRRPLTFFGEAFLEGPLAHGSSLRDAFESARKKVAGWESEGNMLPSEPQISVGKNMQAFWTSQAAGRPRS
jgi:hypothetical protein